MFRTWLATTMIAATAATGVVVAAPPSAADPSFDPCEFAKNLPMKLLPPRALTFHLMVASPYGAVRSAAESAYHSPHGEVAIKAFMPRGWCEATRRAEQEAITHDVIIQRILETHS
ncbi:MAG TPA: hypothetical protein VER55_10205, partial [Ardenticatenaceae bacterium]|nr:hypothetical protein [Ardenticatenaceae bacterium]